MRDIYSVGTQKKSPFASTAKALKVHTINSFETYLSVCTFPNFLDNKEIPVQHLELNA